MEESFTFEVNLDFASGLKRLLNLEVSSPQQCLSLKPAEGISSPLVRPDSLKVEGVVSPSCRRGRSRAGCPSARDPRERRTWACSERRDNQLIVRLLESQDKYPKIGIRLFNLSLKESPFLSDFYTNLKDLCKLCLACHFSCQRSWKNHVRHTTHYTRGHGIASGQYMPLGKKA